MFRPIAAGALYFVGVFALGFLLGTIRVLYVAPRLGEASAVLVELPLMLTASWLLCGLIVTCAGVPASVQVRAVMGTTAFVLLMLGELGVSTLLLGRSAAEHLQTYREASALLGLAAQVAFASFPIIQSKLAGR